MAADEKGYPPGDGVFTAGRPEPGEDAGEKVAAWVRQQMAERDARRTEGGE